MYRISEKSTEKFKKKRKSRDFLQKKLLLNALRQENRQILKRPHISAELVCKKTQDCGGGAHIGTGGDT